MYSLINAVQRQRKRRRIEAKAEVNQFMLCLSALHECANELKIIRVDGRLRRTRCIVEMGRVNCMFTVVSTDFMTSGCRIVGVMWQSETRPKEAICLTIRKRVWDNENDYKDNHDGKYTGAVSERGVLNVSCSCNVDVIGGKVVESHCWHAESLLEDVLFCIVVTKILNESTSGGEQRLRFGDTLTPKRSGKLCYFCIEKETASMAQERVVRKWQFAVLYDDNISMFAQVSNVIGKSLQCCLCCSNSTRRGFCQHDLSCLPTSCKEP